MPNMLIQYVFFIIILVRWQCNQWSRRCIHIPSSFRWACQTRLEWPRPTETRWKKRHPCVSEGRTGILSVFIKAESKVISAKSLFLSLALRISVSNVVRKVKYYIFYEITFLFNITSLKVDRYRMFYLDL